MLHLLRSSKCGAWGSLPPGTKVTTSIGVASRATVSPRVRAGARRAWREHRVLLACVAAYAGGSLVLGPLVGWRLGPPLLSYAMGTFVLSLAAAPFVLSFWWFGELVRQRRAAGWDVPGIHAWKAVWRRVTAPDRLLGITAVLISLWLVMATVAAWRANIPLLHPFAFDVTFASWDERIHGGRQPWVWLQPLLGTPVLTRAIGALYGFVWGAAKIAVVMACAVGPPSHLRRQVLVTYVLEYAVLGSLAATLFSSAGPVYYAEVTGAHVDPFAPLVSYLRAIHADGGFSVVSLQEHLWSEYASGKGFGITAFPSIHVSSSALLGLVGQRFGRSWGVLGWSLCFLTLVGSVHLAWHYAVDGYFSIVAMVALWLIAGRLTR